TGAVIHYTTDGTTPTTSSLPYSTPITIANSATVRAIAVAPGYKNSAIGSAGYTIANAAVVVNAAQGFSPATGLNIVGSATYTDAALQLTASRAAAQDNAVWFTTPVNVQ